MSIQPTEKVYVEIIKKLKMIIDEDKIQAGDKLPSERELTDRLNVGRSSVREALRALELLGLIETRRGEGTFVREATGHRLVEVLASFILNDQKAQQDLIETTHIVIKDCVELAVKRCSSEKLQELEKLGKIIKDSTCEKTVYETCNQFERDFVQSCNNHLLYRLYVELTGYGSSIQNNRSKWPPAICLEVLQELQNKNTNKITDLLSKQNDVLHGIE